MGVVDFVNLQQQKKATPRTRALKLQVMGSLQCRLVPVLVPRAGFVRRSALPSLGKSHWDYYVPRYKVVFYPAFGCNMSSESCVLIWFRHPQKITRLKLTRRSKGKFLGLRLYSTKFKFKLQGHKDSVSKLEWRIPGVAIVLVGMISTC